MPEPIAQRPDMAAYGVDTPDWEALPWSWARERLDGRNYWLATASADGRPHSLPVWGVWSEEDHRFCFSCAPTARKARNLAANPQVVVAIDDTVECISIEGVASRLDPDGDADRIDTWIERYLTKYRPMAPDLGAPFLRRNLVFEVTPERALAVIEREDEFAARATRWVW
ncbi:MAG: pyridoxamine 5'-phosphate oxidase family protein [Ilumatobacter sp.]|uniref:pyridoxamine 5'-phosphate oxidase family protein n=1 Tax=Ilumatobacter sp. TaxID=1967498 RepID=UPI0026333CD1|nr:pyridoxamine 5'-phosphate oxidase family protein [Ilumatobacter sp.]MDJ0768944.1 pyridoxamine 5'-phosphate oxidase family protein [Ilumatobacter sp.]